MESSAGRDRTLSLVVASVLLILGFFLARAGRIQLSLSFVLLDGLAWSWALLGGMVALTVYRTVGSFPVFLVALALLGAGILDIHHALATASMVEGSLSEGLQAKSGWSWALSRLFFSAVLYLTSSSRAATGWAAFRRHPFRSGAPFVVAVVAIVLLLAGSERLPPRLLRAAAFLPAAFFLGALGIGLRKGGYRSDRFEYSLVLSSLFGLFSDGLYASLPGSVFDTAWVFAHLLRIAGYAVLLAGVTAPVGQRLHGGFDRPNSQPLEPAAADAVAAGIRPGVKPLETPLSNILDLASARAHTLNALEAARESKRRGDEAERLFREVLEWALDPMVIVDRSGAITVVNNAARKLFGYEEDELIGKSIEVLVPEGARASHSHHRESYMRHPTVRGMGAGLDLWAKRKDGSLVPIEVSLNPIETEAGTLVTSVIHDLTERKQAEAEIARYTRELERSNAELEQFAYVASHDLQEPLRMVSSFTQLLAKRYRGKLGPDADEFIAHAVDGAQRMQELIRDLLKFSRAGTTEGSLRKISCEVVMASVLENLHFTIDESGARVTQDALPTVRADPTQLVQLFQNLIANAIKFRGPDPPAVHVGLAQADGHWLFSVRDNGIGIESEYRDRVFEIFKRLHGREEYPGTGIGLAICKRIVERHGGKIWLESHLGEGTVFYFTFPRAKEAS